MPISADIPLLSVPFVDAEGMINEAWFILLIQLWRRTGSGGGVSPSNIVNIPDETIGTVGLPSSNMSTDVFGLEALQLVGVVQQIVADAIAMERTKTIAAVEEKLSEMLFSQPYVQACIPDMIMGVSE